MKYNNIVNGLFISRPNRFIARVLIDGEEELVHVKNTGRCKELLIPGAKVLLEDCSHNPNRKTRYSLVAVWKDDMLVNMDSQAPNQVVYDGIKSNKVSGLKNLTSLKREVSFGNSRFDLYFESKSERGFIEVKGVTLEDEGISMFPDAPTTRGTKHVLEMIEAVEQGYIGIIFFLIQMKGPEIFKLNWSMDENFSQGVKLAHKKGVKVFAYDSIVSPDGLLINKPIEIDLNRP